MATSQDNQIVSTPNSKPITRLAMAYKTVFVKLSSNGLLDFNGVHVSKPLSYITDLIRARRNLRGGYIYLGYERDDNQVVPLPESTTVAEALDIIFEKTSTSPHYFLNGLFLIGSVEDAPVAPFG